MYLGKKKRLSLINTILEINSLKKCLENTSPKKILCSYEGTSKKSLNSQGREYEYSKQREEDRQIQGLWENSI